MKTINCGSCYGCCGPIIPCTVEEKIDISNYINKHNIRNIGSIEGYCRFLDKKGKCMIYEVRPKICQWFGLFKNPALRCPKYPRFAKKQETNDMLDYRKEIMERGIIL